MKGRLVRCAILLMICVLAHAAHLPDSCSFENETLSVGQHTRRCLKITCHAGSEISILGCPLARCPEGKQVGYRDTDFSKPYPDCCGGPICKEEKS
ncbi:uncharacterized protein LOC126852808 [Cataglyphis hispanica]|uniref:uncharacterized protein LOC126852808 n=1 Tax=Cataglyphis hispanica TaxID=1086592 RepID=UPI00217FDD33|nr:uncharacterized protein LOC126852808 [Cataglyphis hispanica]